jgi:hypothetical protein
LQPNNRVGEGRHTMRIHSHATDKSSRVSFHEDAVTFSFGQLLEEGFQIKAEKPDQMLVGG